MWADQRNRLGVYGSYIPVCWGLSTIYTHHQWLQDAKLKYTDFQLENSNNVIGYFYDVAPKRIYKNRQEN